MVDEINSTPNTSSSISGSSSGGTFTVGSFNLVRKFVFWHADSMRCYIKNTGGDDIYVKITVQLTEDGDEIEELSSTQLTSGSSTVFDYDKPAYYVNLYVKPSSSSSAWKYECILRWKR